MRSNQTQSDPLDVFWLIFGVLFVIAVILNYTVGPADPSIRDAREYRELREHEEAKVLGRALYEHKKEHLGR